VDEFMTLSRYRKLTDHWKKSPPIHISLSAISGALGGKSTAKQPSRQDSDEEDYVPPEIDSTNDVTGLMAGPVFSDAFAVRKLRVIHIDNRKN
jgi:hypothetical protein